MTKKDLKQYKMHSTNVEILTGTTADLYVMTFEDAKELVKKFSINPLLSSRSFRLTDKQFHRIGLLSFYLRNEAKREPRARKVEEWGFAIQRILDAAAEKNGR